METILAVSGKPGLYKLVSRGHNAFIVEALDTTHRRQPVFASERMMSLADIAMFTDSEDVPLWQVLAKVGEKEGLKACAFNYKKASSAQLFDYFGEVLPAFDRDRVHGSDVKKLLQWYDILVAAGMTDFEHTLKPTEGDNVADRQEA